MNGVGNGRFDPDGTTTRAMVVTMLWRREGQPQGGSGPFIDVPAGAWYAQPVNWAAEAGVVKGFTETSCGPDEPVTREQLAVILYRCAQEKGKGFTGSWSFPLAFPDAAEVSEYADEAMHWMTMNGVIQGMGDGTLAPRANATRAQVAAMFQRFCENSNKNSRKQPPQTELNRPLFRPGAGLYLADHRRWSADHFSQSRKPAQKMTPGISVRFYNQDHHIKRWS